MNKNDIVYWGSFTVTIKAINNEVAEIEFIDKGQKITEFVHAVELTEIPNPAVLGAPLPRSEDL